MIFLTKPRLKIMVAIIIGIIDSGSVILSKISQELKSDFSEATEPSKKKRIFRFLTNKKINNDMIQYSFAKSLRKIIKIIQEILILYLIIQQKKIFLLFFNFQ